MTFPSFRRGFAGFSLIELIVALLIIATGILGILKFQAELFQSVATSKQRSIATALAQDRLEQIRAYITATGYDYLSALDTTPNDGSAGYFGSSSGETIARDGTTFTLVTTIASHDSPYKYLDTAVNISWVDAAGQDFNVVLRSAVAWSDPSSGGQVLANTPPSTSGNCTTQTVTDNLCRGTAATTSDGASVTVTYSAGGAGSGVFSCVSGSFVKQSGTCSANCGGGGVSDGTCTGTVPATNHGLSVNVTYSAGGTGTGVWACGNGSWTKSSGTCTPLQCTLPWGGTLSNGGTVTAYNNPAPTSACSSVSATLTCNNGTLSPTGYTNASCSEPCAGGTLGTVASGSSVTAYQASTGSSCVSESRTCSNGTLSGSYTYASCTPTVTASCSVGGTTYAAGSTKDFYQSSSAASCSSRTYTCDGASGSFKRSGTTNTADGYTFETCSSAPCTYTVTSNFSTNDPKFCTDSSDLNAFLTAATCTSGDSRKTITCVGSLAVGASKALTLVPKLAGSGSSCTTKTYSCSTGTLTCNASAVALSSACTVTP